eukprot:155651-Pleurochrysis_carterae.AAC.1
MSNTVAPQLSLVPMASRRWPRRFGGRCSAWQQHNRLQSQLGRTGDNFEKTRAPIEGAIGKHAKVRNVGVVGFPGSVRVEVKAIVFSDALCELVVVDF